jgi:hypothetical protein
VAIDPQIIFAMHEPGNGRLYGAPARHHVDSTTSNFLLLARRGAASGCARDWEGAPFPARQHPAERWGRYDLPQHFTRPMVRNAPRTLAAIAAGGL